MSAMIIQVQTSLPAHAHSQSEVTAALAPRLAPSDGSKKVLERLHGNTKIDQRHFVLPISEYTDIDSFTKANTLFAQHALTLVEDCTRKALANAGLNAEEVDHLFFTTVTGVGAPALDVLLAARMGFRPDIKRIPSFGLGCAGGAAGIARVADYLLGDPTAVALVVSVELCSLTIQWEDRSMANYVGTGIFGDGAAAVVMVGSQHTKALNGIAVKATRSTLYSDSESLIGWKIGSSGLSLMLEAGVPEMITEHFAAEVDVLLSKQGLSREDIDVWIAHPGGPKILEAFASSLDLADSELSASWDVMARAGNMSSAAVLHVLSDLSQQPSSTVGVLFAVGPGVSLELVLLEWT
jgi:alkylresorcinol/alkylpyrone synthase